jgi:ribosomal protein L32
MGMAVPGRRKPTKQKRRRRFSPAFVLEEENDLQRIV